MVVDYVLFQRLPEYLRRALAQHHLHARVYALHTRVYGRMYAVCSYVPHMYADMYRICMRICTAYVCGYTLV